MSYETSPWDRESSGHTVDHACRISHNMWGTGVISQWVFVIQAHCE